jgi:hypothetical protein
VLGLPKGTLPVAYGPRKSAPNMAEHLALEQFRRDRGAIDGNERARTAPSVAMDGAGNDLLSGSRLAGDEHGGIAIGDAANRLGDRAHRRACSHQLVAIDGRQARRWLPPLARPYHP